MKNEQIRRDQAYPFHNRGLCSRLGVAVARPDFGVLGLARAARRPSAIVSKVAGRSCAVPPGASEDGGGGELARSDRFQSRRRNDAR